MRILAPFSEVKLIPSSAANVAVCVISLRARCRSSLNLAADGGTKLSSSLSSLQDVVNTIAQHIIANNPAVNVFFMIVLFKFFNLVTIIYQPLHLFVTPAY